MPTPLPRWSEAPLDSKIPPTCRRGGCSAPAVGSFGLCKAHEASQRAVRVKIKAPEHRKPYPSHADAAFRFAANLAAARTAPWRATAACHGKSDVMFPATTPGRGHPTDYTAALALCAGCPVIEPCRDAGAHEPDGVWGGTTPSDRAKRRGKRSV